jgi:Ca-activated chloride channel family protein
MEPRGRRFLAQFIAVVVGIGLIFGLRSWTSGDGVEPAPSGSVDIGDCFQFHVAASSEKAALLGQIADDFNATRAQVGGRCAAAIVDRKASGEAMTALANGWDESVDGPRPSVWTPAASTWGVLLEQRLAQRDAPDIVPASFESIAWSPLVIAMPRRMAEALGWPDEPIGWRTIFDLANDPQGWGSVGHPEWGDFQLGKTNPNYSTSGLHALVGAYFAATGLSSDLSLDDVRAPQVRAFVSGVESSVVHYGDISLTFLENLYQADLRGEGLGYISAVTIEEKSVWDYNQGNPSGDPATLGDRGKPSEPLVAIYPEEGTLASDHPWYILDAPWVGEDERAGAQAFLEFLQRDEQQERFQDFAFRNFRAEPGPLITRENGLLPGQPTARLSPPAPPVLDEMLSSWEDLRKPARVLLLLDVSGSMGVGAGNGRTKLALAKEAAIQALDLFGPNDEVGLWIFSTDITPGVDHVELVPVGPVGQQRGQLVTAIRQLTDLNGTPLYSAVRDAVHQMRLDLDPTKINGVVLLSDGENEDPRNDDLAGLLRDLDSELNVRVFPVAFGDQADLETLRQIAFASRAAVYDSRDPTSIGKVFVSVISNF